MILKKKIAHMFEITTKKLLNGYDVSLFSLFFFCVPIFRWLHSRVPSTRGPSIPVPSSHTRGDSSPCPVPLPRKAVGWCWKGKRTLKKLFFLKKIVRFVWNVIITFKQIVLSFTCSKLHNNATATTQKKKQQRTENQLSPLSVVGSSYLWLW